MQFFYVRKSVSLQLPHKQLVLEAPFGEAWGGGQVPISHIYCGNIAWEAIHAKEAIGAENVVVLPWSVQIQNLLPSAFLPHASGHDLVTQAKKILFGRPEGRRNQPFRIALINGVGTMLGDTLVGTCALEIAIRKLRVAIGEVEVHAVQAWNARQGTELILARSPAVSHVHGRSISLATLNAFDAYYDFSSLLQMEGYDDVPLVDFYLNHLGVDPAEIRSEEKVPQLRLPSLIVDEAKALVDAHRNGQQVVLVQGQASTPLRSMPEDVMVHFVDDILSTTDACVLLTHLIPEQVLRKHGGRVIQLSQWCQSSTDHYMALVAMADALVSIDSLAIHVAAAAAVPGVVIFTTLEPKSRLAYAPHLTGMLIPSAQTLSMWGKHKNDDRWVDVERAYKQAWGLLDRVAILARLQKQKDT